MERRMLFKRRSLFSDVAPQKTAVTRRKLFCSTPKKMVCQDCGHEIETMDVTTAQVCPNCGGNRFNLAENIKGTGTARRSLFSSLTRTQPNSDGEGTYNQDQESLYKCSDCGETFLGTYGERCPKCGGNRVEKQEEIGTPDATDELLKDMSGREVSQEDLQKEFSQRGIEMTVESLCNSGDAKVNGEGMVCFSENADQTRRLFSELVISVTKELHLVPTEGRLEEMISGLEEHGNINPKGIVLVKKAHGLMPNKNAVSMFSETSKYLEDSGLVSDLKLEWGGKKMALKEFMNLLNTQYNDAPDDILDELVDSGVIKISGSQVEIL